MSDKEKKIMGTCGALVPQLTELEKEKFLSFTEGMEGASTGRSLVLELSKITDERWD